MTVDVLARRPVGRTSVRVSPLGIGGGSLFNRAGADGVQRVLDHAWEVGLRYFDTAAFYVGGISEERFGAALQARPRGEFALSTKLGRYQTPEGDRQWFDYSADGAARSVETSLARLRTDRLDIVYIHDVEPALHRDAYEARFAEAMDGALPVLLRLKESGTVAAIGVGMSDPMAATRFVRTGAFDCVMLAGAYTMLRHDSLDSLMPACDASGVSVIVAAALNTGILATGAVPGARFDYRDATPEVMARVAAIEAVCTRHAVPLAAAALQFPLAHPAVAAIVVGHQTPGEVDANRALLTHPVPPEFWAELKHAMLIRADAP